MRPYYVLYVLSILLAFGLGACSSKPKAQGSFQALECKTICEKNECSTRCLSADGSFKKK